MAHSRYRPILGFTSALLLILSIYLLISLTRMEAEPRTFRNMTAIAISGLAISVLYSWLALGKAFGIAFTALAAIVSVLGIIRTSHPQYLIFAPTLFLTAIAGYSHYRMIDRVARENILKLEKLEEKTNLLSNDIKTKAKSITALEEKLNRYSILKEVVEALSTVLSIEAVNKLIMEKTFKTIGKAGRTLLFLVDSQKQELMLSASMNADAALKVKAKKGDAFDHWILRHRVPLMIEDVTKDFRFPAEASDSAKGYFRSLIGAPFMSENKVMGILRMDDTRELSYMQDDLRLLDILSDLGAVAIQNALLYSRTRELAIRDGLTDLFLRRYFMERFGEEVKRAARKNGTLSLLILDIDHFKEYNDRYGHTSGDLVLKHLAGLVSSALHQGGIAARYGGEEIAVLLSGAGKNDAAREAEAIRKRIEANPLSLRRQKMGITISIGISAYPEDATLEEELIRIADERLYKAKSKGRNRVCAGP